MSTSPFTRAVVTGAGSGLGRAFSIELAQRGARLVVSDIDLAAAEATRAALATASGSRAVQCDVVELGQVEALAAAAFEHLGGVDLVINNAGVAAGGRIGEIPIEDWRWVVGVNLWGPIHGCHVFAPRLRRQGSGHILNVASAAGLLSSPQMGPYNTTKSAVVALSETLYSELREAGVGVSVLCPTFFQTNIANASRVNGDPAMLDMVRGLMTGARVQAADVARIALDGAANGDLYILPHADGRWIWRLKRLNPGVFQWLAERAFTWRAASLATPTSPSPK